MQKNKTSTPLRFPGSKSRVYNRLHRLLNTYHEEYRDPFFGGGSLFFKKKLSLRNWINDKDPLVYSFFVTVRDNPLDLCNKIKEIGTPTISYWKYMRAQKHESTLEKAFSFLFFNRTNYSGIYKANPIGGMNQKSEWKIDCRWNPNLLCERILNCSDKLQKVNITCNDFEEAIIAPGENVLLFLDPPYYQKGSQLYPVSMSPEEHQKLSNLLKKTKHKFLLTIDDCEETRHLYFNDGFYINFESWSYTIKAVKSTGKEIFISNFNDSLEGTEEQKNLFEIEEIK